MQPASLSMVGLGCVTFAVAAAAAPASDTTVLTIPAQPLADALAQLSALTNAPVIAPAALIAGKTSTPVSGVKGAGAAINQMLKDAGLEARLEPNGVFVVVRQTAKAAIEPASIGESITIYGAVSGGLARALDVKRHADSIVDAMVAADIGKLPAVNAAEALQHLVGVTISRESGEGEFVGVRGLGPTFQSVTFDGVPLAVNENIRNSDQSGRQFRFRVLPSDLIGSIVVTKSPTSDLIDGGIGANIDIVTLRPLVCDPFRAFRLYVSTDEQAGRVTPNGAVSTCWKSPDGRFGAIAGFSLQRRDAEFDRFQNFGYDKHTVDGIANVDVPDGWSTTVEEERRRRLSFAGGIEWQPFVGLDVRSDVLYSRFNNAITENRVSYDLGKEVVSALVPGSARIDDGVLVAAEITGGGIARNVEYSEQLHDNLAVRLGLDWNAADWRIASTVSFSHAGSNLDTPLQRIESKTAVGASLRYGYDLGAHPARSGKIRSLATTLDLTDPAATSFVRYRIRPTRSEDQDATLLINLYRPLAMSLAGISVNGLRFGGQWTDRHRDYQRRDRNLTARDGVIVDDSFFSGAVPAQAMAGIIVDARSAWSGPDFGKFAESFVVAGEFDGVAPQTQDLVPNAADLRQSYRVEEKIRALYLRLNFSADQAAAFSGNLGLRWVNTETAVFGVTVPVQSVERMTARPRTTVNGYGVLLPSFNMAIDLADDFTLRLAASRSLTRPSLASLRDATVPSSATVSAIYENGAAALAGGLDRAAVGGNPTLSPILSSNADLSLEWYFEGFGALTASAFYKDIDNFIAGEVSIEAMPFEVRGGAPMVLDVEVNRPQNIGTARLAGLELGYSGRCDNGLGLSFSATFTDTKVMLRRGVLKRGSLQGVSDVSYSVTPFFDNGLVDIYFSYTYRSAFESNANVTIASSVETDPEEATIAAGFGTLDFGAALRISESVEVFAEGVNLSDSHQTAYIGRDARLYQIHDYGRTFNIGIRGHF